MHQSLVLDALVLGSGKWFHNALILKAKCRQGKSMVEVPTKLFGFPVTCLANEQRLKTGLKQ